MESIERNQKNPSSDIEAKPYIETSQDSSNNLIQLSQQTHISNEGTLPEVGERGSCLIVLLITH